MRLPSELQERIDRAAFSAYLDAAQSTKHIHDRLSNGAEAAARAVVSVLDSEDLIRKHGSRPQAAVHGSKSGYEAGCDCEFCHDARLLAERALRYWTRVQGDNKVRIPEARTG